MKQYNRYRMDFDGRWLRWSATCIGASMFLQILQYAVLQELTTPGAHIWNLWVPLAFGLVYIILLRGIRLNAPGVYAILGLMVCIWLLIGVFSAGDTLRTVLATIGYLLCGAVLILCAGGFLPGRLPAAICFGVVFAVRLYFYGFGRITGADWLPEIPQLGFLVALICLPMGMVPGKPKQ